MSTSLRSVHVRIPEDQYDQLVEIAGAERRSLSSMAGLLLADGLALSAGWVEQNRRLDGTSLADMRRDTLRPVDRENREASAPLSGLDPVGDVSGGQEDVGVASAGPVTAETSTSSTEVASGSLDVPVVDVTVGPAEPAEDTFRSFVESKARRPFRGPDPKR